MTSPDTNAGGGRFHLGTEKPKRIPLWGDVGQDTPKIRKKIRNARILDQQKRTKGEVIRKNGKEKNRSREQKFTNDVGVRVKHVHPD